MPPTPATPGLALLDDSHYGAYAVNIDQIIWYWNPAAERITGHSAADVVGRPCHQVLQNLMGDGEKPVCLGSCPSLTAVKAGRIPPAYDVLMLCASGQRKPILLTPLVIGAAKGQDTVLVHLLQEPARWRNPARVATTVSAALSLGPSCETPLVSDLVTDRELEVLRLVAVGITPQEVASILSVSYHTVRNHTASLRRKLSAANSRALVRRARELGLI